MTVSKQFSLIHLGWMAALALTALTACATSTPGSDTPRSDQTELASTMTSAAIPSSTQIRVQTSTYSPSLVDKTPMPTTTACVQEGCPSSLLESGTMVARTATTTPIPTPTQEMPESCLPFPDHIVYLAYYIEVGAAICNGELVSFHAPIGDGWPWFVQPWDYTPKTGRIAFGKNGLEEPGLWIYDFWTERTTKWLDDAQLREVSWSPVLDNQGKQTLALLLQDGTLALITEPEQMLPIENEVTTFSWSPAGDQIAFVKHDRLYIFPSNGGQSRFLAQGVSGVPIWSIEEGVIFIVTTPSRYIELGEGREVDPDYPGAKVALRDHPFKIVRLDGTGSFFPAIPNGIYPSEESKCMNTELLWAPEKHIVMGGNYVYELTDDLKTIINRQTYSCHNLVDTYFASLLEYSKRLPVQFLLYPNSINANLPLMSSWSDFHAIEEVYETGRISTQAEVLSNFGDSIYIQSYTYPGSDYGLFASYRKVVFSEYLQVLDEHGTQITPEALKKGMHIDIVARRLSEDTLTLLAIRIQILPQEDHDQE